MELDGCREEATPVKTPNWRIIVMLTVLAMLHAHGALAQPPAFERERSMGQPREGYVDPDSVRWEDGSATPEVLPDIPPGEFAPLEESSPFADAFDDRNFWYDAFGYYGDHGHQYYESDACSACGGNSCEFCGGAGWYTDAAVQMLRRGRAKRTTLTRGALTVDNDPVTGLNTVSFLPGPFFNTDAAEFDVQPGLRVTVGRYLGLDEKNRSHSIEGVFYGLQEWDTKASMQGELRQEFTTTDANGAVILIEAGQLVSDFALDLGGFNRADLHAFRYSSNFNTAELNYRIRWQYRPNRISPAKDGRWDKKRDTDWLPNFIIGLRYHNVDEDFAFLSRGIIAVNGIDMPISGDWTTSTQNNMIGPQIGGGLLRKTRRWEVGVDGKIGLLINSATLDGRIVVNDPVFPLDQFAPVTNPLSTAVPLSRWLAIYI